METNIKTKECPTCEGTGDGDGYVSSCCGVRPRSNGDCDTMDYGICPECGDHCDYENKCPDCDGVGKLEVVKN